MRALSVRFSAARARRVALAFGLAAWALAQAPDAGAQVTERTIIVPTGKATLVTHADRLTRVSMSNPLVAEAVVVSPYEVLINGRQIGTTTLVLWDAVGGRELFAVEVTADAIALERQFKTLFPEETIG